jgi:hypothetical protein
MVGTATSHATGLEIKAGSSPVLYHAGDREEPMAFLHVNYLSIFAAAVAAWLFGAAYYTALSKHWLAALDKTMEQCQAEQAAKTGIAKYAPFITVFVAELIIAYVLYGLLMHMGNFTVRAGIISAGLCWFGFVLTTVTVNNAFSGRKTMLTVIDAGGWLGAFVIIGAVIGGMGAK